MAQQASAKTSVSSCVAINLLSVGKIFVIMSILGAKKEKFQIKINTSTQILSFAKNAMHNGYEV